MNFWKSYFIEPVSPAVMAVLAFFLLCSPACSRRADNSNSSNNTSTVSRPNSPNLTGTIETTNGMSLPGAIVFIYEAAPKHGPGILCPSCYADCVKQAITDPNGNFTITNLDPDLVFKVLVAATGFEPRFVNKVDPAVKPLLVKLKPQLGGQKPDEMLTGRIVDPDGKPISGAVINIRGVSRGQGTQFGGNDDVDPLAVSDGVGNFLITSLKPFDAAGVDVEARGFATGIFPNLATGGDVHTLKLTEGASLKGRVVKNGKPTAGVEMRVSGADREASVYAGNFSVASDTNGNFLFVNLPPDQAYVLCGTMKSLGARGCVPMTTVRVQADGTTEDVGDVDVKPAFVLAGQIHLTDGKPLPAHERVALGRDDAWDYLQIQTDKNGHFRFVGVPAELVTLTARVPGYHFSLRNGSLDTENMRELIGRVSGDETNLILEFEPGNNSGQFHPDYATREMLEREPLRGAEAVGPAPDDIKVTGTVVDAATGKPISAFTVTEGREIPYGMGGINWLPRQSPQSNGVFTVYLHSMPHMSPAISVAANGYMPIATDLIASGTNFSFALKKGNGPAGVVLKPDGKPAANVTVYLTGSGQEQGVYIQGGDKLTVRDDIYRSTRKTRTDGAGHFAFKPQPDDYAIIVVDPSGFAEVHVANLETNSTVQLQKYARVEGQLMIGSHAGSNETINLDLAYTPYADYPRDFPPISLFLQTHTDADGEFVFNQVPPITVKLTYQPNVRDDPSGIIPESQTVGLLLKPGESRRVTMGGKGRPVTGRLVVQGHDGKIDYRAEVQSIDSDLTPPPGMPDLSAISAAYSAKMRSADTDEARKAATAENEREWKAAMEKMREFCRSAAGQQYYLSQARYALDFSPDGSFRIQDVPGGKYKLSIELHEGSGGGIRFNQPLIGSLTKEIVVPDSPGGRSDEPFEVGTLEMMAQHNLKPGQIAAPNFDVKTLDGKPLKLSDFKGKYVLLDFWATWCGPCVAETPYLKATWDAFGHDPRFAMVSLSLDPEVSAPRKFAVKNGIGWTQGFLGDWSKTDLPNQFGAIGIPSIFLIGPDGKIIARDLRGGLIKLAVANALKNE